MFELLSRRVPRSVALVLTGLWYAALIWAIFFCLAAPDAQFRYWWI
jgi:hypothetical protein